MGDDVSVPMNVLESVGHDGVVSLHIHTHVREDAITLFGFDTISALLGPAVVIALVSFAETYSVGKAISSETKQKVDVDQEFVGQGMANIIGSFFQCYPVSGSFSRTAINLSSGAKTGVSSVVSSLSVIVTLLFLTPL